MQVVLGRREGVREPGVLLLDLDGAEAVDATYGHDADDEVLLTAERPG